MKLPERSKTSRTWCGPYALAVAADREYDDVFTFCKVALRKPRLAGMYNHEMSHVATKLGLGKIVWEDVNKLTLKNVLDYLIPNRLYIVNVTRHYVLLDTRNWLIADNQSAAWETIGDCKYKQTQVIGTAEIRRI